MNDESTADDGANDGGPRKDQVTVQRVEIPLSALIIMGLIVVGTILVLRAIDRTQQLIALALFAGILSALLAPVIGLLQRVVGRAAAAVLLHIVVLVVMVAGTGLIIQQIRAESESLAAFAEQQIDDVEGEPSQVLQQTRFDERLGEAAANWGTNAILGNDDTAGIATRVSELTIVVVLSIFFTLQGGAIVDMAVAWTDDRQRRRLLRERWGRATSSAALYLRRNVLVAAVSGLAASALAASFGLPAVVLVGAWAALLSVVPLLGAVVGWAPLVVLAVIELSAGAALAVAGLAICGVIAVNVLRARLVVAPVKPGSFLVAMSIACGITAAGIPGAMATMFALVAVVSAIGSRPSRLEVPTAIGDSHEERDEEETPISSAVLEELADRGARPAQPAGDGQRPLVLTLSRRTAAQITAFVVLAFVVQLAITRVGPILVWAIVGALIAIGLDRPVSWAESRLRLSRPVIVLVSAIVGAGAIAALLLTATGSIDETRPVDEGIPELVASLSELPLVGDSFADADMEARIERFQRDLPRLITRSPVAGQAFGLLGSGVVGAFWVTVAALSCLLDGPRLVRAIDRRVPARITRQTTRLARAGKVALGGYVGGAAVVAAMNGGIVLLLGLALGVPMVALLALWAFSWNFIPQVGAIIGWAPLLFLGLLESPIRGAAGLLFFVVYQVIENNLIQPSIVGNAVDIGALAALGAALAGAALAGLIGAALAIPVAGVARALYVEARREDFPPVRLAESREMTRVLP